MKPRVFIFHFIFLLSLPSFSATRENNFFIFPEENLVSGLNEEQFHRVIDSFEKIIVPIAKTQGKTLVVDRFWSEARVDANASSLLGKWIIGMYGGFARHPAMTEELLLMSLCHEAGHFMGGSPRKSSGRSHEGQADYYSALVCMKEMWKSEDNQKALHAIAIDPIVQEKCKGEALCSRISMLGLSMSRFDALFSNDPPPQFSTPDKSRVKATNESYPSAQCRLDTYFAGATNGPRPSCWYLN